MKKRIYLFTALLAWGVSFAYSQQVDIENLKNIGKNKPLTVTGGLSAGSIFYDGNAQSGRQPWTYYLNGTVNFNLFGMINLPFSLNLTNLGKDFSYPSMPNRFSLHPTYKWATAHIGDVAMTFSPYTLSGHQFTGAGVELTPGKWKISAMGGRLLKEVAYDETAPSITPTYRRVGMGADVQYLGDRFSVGMIYFAAKDKENAMMQEAMDSLAIRPMENQALSWNVGIDLVKNLSLKAEYALSLLNIDTRASKRVTYHYHAFNAQLSYQLWKNTIGVGYERIDPGYRTLGAYYFNNDYENLTLNYARPFLKDDKGSVAASFGVQRDNLDGKKEETSRRYVGSLNLTYNPTENVQLSANYSTFQNYRNLKSQFDYINEMSPYDNMDTLRFTQLSQNLDFAANYTFKKTKQQQQRLSLTVSYQESADRQGGISLPGNVSRFLNSALGYGLQLIPQAISLTSSLNASYSYASVVESYTIGPMVGLTAAFLKKQLTTDFSTAYNVNVNAGSVAARVLNLRLNAAYRIKKRHNFNANVVWQNRDIKTRGKTDAVTTTVAYSYSF
ncbi:MAG: hypothetical protein LBN24_02815 [Mediterranea sp.]|jgi:hypothetical protein|nr:hypothetical protein [Mediterranea sp.]